jgi:serine phosphatase RsbU (regulator of sigma subunit)
MFWLPYFVGLAYLAVGAWVYRIRGLTLPVRAFTFFSVCAALANGLLFDLSTTHAAPFLWTVAISQIGGALISLGLVFPEEWAPVKRWPVMRLLPYIISIILMVWGVAVVNSKENPWAYITAWRFSYVYAALAIFIFLGIMLYRQATARSDIARQQARIVLWGSLLAFGPVSIYLGAPLLRMNVLWNPAIFTPFLLIFPISIGISILRYRLWDIDVIINRTLVYSLLTVLLAAIYFGSVFALYEIFSNLIGQASELASVAATLVIVAVFTPLRKNLQNFIDSRFYRRKYDTAKTLSAFSQTLRDEVDLPALVKNLQVVIGETIMPAYVQTWLRSGSGYRVGSAERVGLGDQVGVGDQVGETNGESPLELANPMQAVAEIPIQDPVIDFFSKAAYAAEIEGFDLVSPGLETLKTMGVEMVVPLVTHGELVGWISLGPRLSGQEYSADDRALLSNLAVQAAPAVHVAQLVVEQQAEVLRRERLEHEMNVARRIQHALLPKELPKLEDWRLAAYYQPARAVGGDFYDFVSFEDGRTGLFIGDVTDKGVPAALVMATTRTLLRAVALEALSPGQVLERVNNLLMPDIPANMFVTCLVAILDPASGRLQYANAGQNLPYRRTRDGVSELHATGMPLGLFADMFYEEKEVVIEPGDCVIFYSDGLVEAHNNQRQMFGSERVQILLGEGFEDGQTIIDCLLNELQSFTGKDWEQEDDITLVGLKRLTL